MNSTPVSLLERLREPNAAGAWSRFVHLYTPLLYFWAKRMRLQDSDAADLVQDVLTLLVQKLPSFQYDRDRSFRNWLRTVLQNQLRAKVRNRSNGVVAMGSAASEIAAPTEIDDLSEREYREMLVARALQMMQVEFSPSVWKACWEHVVRGRSAADVAKELNIAEGTVYVAKGRVLFRLREELKDLLE